jgi:cell division transport system permease protein
MIAGRVAGTMARAAPADRRLLPEGRLNGPMPWIIAVMTFLAALALVGGLALQAAASGLGEGLRRQATIQIATADPVARARQARAAAAIARALPGVAAVRPVASAEMDRLLAPWLGPDAGANLPLPALIDVELAPGVSPTVLNAALSKVAPAARIDPHDVALAPLAGLVSSLRVLSGGLVLLMAVTMAAVIALAARGAMVTHRATVETLHLLGATDGRIAGLFARRLGLDALLGAGIGALAAGAALWALGRGVAALESGLAALATPGTAALLALVLLPFATAGLAVLAARTTVRRALAMTL